MNKLTTPFEISGKLTWDEYPRPQLKRDSYMPLNGKWDLSVVKSGKSTSLGQINVPFSPESRLSGIERELQKGEKYIYTRSVSLGEAFDGGKVILHLGAVDQICEVNVNGQTAAKSENGYLPIEADITALLKDGENVISVEVIDETDTELPYGKQSKKRGGMWYTATSGIWQNVWIERVPENYIRGLRMSSSGSRVTIKCIGGNEAKLLTLTEPGRVTQYKFKGDEISIDIPEPRFWSPEDPYLYSFTLTDGEDRVESYFALREMSIKEVNGRQYICLNGKPYFFHGLLDQGYFSDGIYTPATPEGYLFDIITMKNLGFNMLRKHIKIEPELFYYYCDKFGMIVFQDMVNSGKYSFLVDTLLPTIGKKVGITHKASARRRAAFESAAERTIELLYNHPSVCYYTVFNEGWGQYDADRLYTELKSKDPTRVWDATSGWFAEQKSDVVSEHVYFKKVPTENKSTLPRVLSEFGGYSCKLDENSFNLKKTYGYRFFKDTESFSKALAELYVDEILPAAQKGLNAAVLTQVSDVEDETNGLVTYDRQVVKVDSVLMNKIAKALKKAFADSLN